MRYDFEAAIADYNEAIASEPSNARAYLGRGWAKWLHGDDDGARKDINEALRLDPGLGNAYNLRAFIKLNEGDYAGADADYTKAMDLDPTLRTADTYTNRGLARLRKEDTRAAEEDFNRALKINPEYARALALRIAARMMTTRTKVARGDFTSLAFPGEFVQMLMLTGGLGECHGIELNNKYTGRYLQLGLEYCNNNELDKAIALFTKAIELNPDLPEAYNNRGYVYAKRNWNERAMKDYRKALNIDPDFSPTRRNVAELLKQLNSQQEFIKKKQAQLSQLGYYEGEIDGVVTPAHTEAIKRFQKAHGLGATGDLDYETYEALERAYESSNTRANIGGLNRNEFTVRFPQDGYETDESDIALDAALNSDTRIERVVVKVNGETIKNPSNPEYNPSYTKAKIDWKLPLHLGQNEIDLIAFTESGFVGKKLTVVRRADKQNPETPPSKWAVVIGIEDYEDKKMTDLKYAGNDAEAFAHLLIEKGNFPADHVILLTDKPPAGSLNKATREEPTYYNIKKALFTMLRTKAQKKDSIIIFYSGHGVLVPDATTLNGKAAYLAPKDFEYDNPEVKGLRMDEVKRLASFPRERIFLILDCCFSGGGGKDVKSVDYGITIKGGPDDITGGFAGKGRVLFASSLDNQVSIESDKLKHGVFTHFLLDVTNKGEKRLSEIYRYVHRNVLKFTRGDQEPKLDTADQRGDILIY